MSLSIDVDGVCRVKIAGEWVAVKLRTFDLDAYEYRLDGDAYSGTHWQGDEKIGFTFVDQDREERWHGPLSSIQAVVMVGD